MPQNAPLKYVDIKDQIGSGVRSMTPDSLAFFLGSQIPGTQPGIDPRRLPFADVSPQLRDQRQRLMGQVPQNNPFSLAEAMKHLQVQANTPK